MVSSSGIKIVMGGAGLFRAKPATEAPKLLSLLRQHKVDRIDSAIFYGDSEEVLGLNDAGANFVLDTKIPGGFREGTAKKDMVLKLGRESLEKLKVKQIDTLYIHAPDASIPFEETFRALNELHQQGVFRRLGLSNFTVDQVEQVCSICEQKGFVAPGVYQGNYNAFARSYEQTLLPVLRKRGISFYAYSPQAGGFLNKSSELVKSGKGEGRVLSGESASDIYKALYKKPTLLEGLTKWNEIASEAGITPGELAVRWVRYNSVLKPEHGDAVIIGGRTLEQVEQTLVALEGGPLSDSVTKKIDEVWLTVKGEAPVDNYHDFVQQTITGK